jgi:hypothetical protein
LITSAMALHNILATVAVRKLAPPVLAYWIYWMEIVKHGIHLPESPNLYSIQSLKRSEIMIQAMVHTLSEKDSHELASTVPSTYL